MNNRLLRILLFAVFGSLPASARDSLLVWQDEFDKPGLPDPSRWNWDEGGSGMGNEEAQYYTKSRLANARVEGGHLVITARREDTLTCWYGPCKFTSARLVTRGIASWKYGRVDVRAKLPAGKGVWPAIWMLPEVSTYGGWPGGGEIDIMEFVGHEPQKVYGTVHTKAYNHPMGTQKGGNKTLTDLGSAWHVYSLEWEGDSLHVGVDGVRYFDFANEGTWEKWPFDQPFHLLLNLAVGGAWGGAQGVDTTVFPQQFLVDWVRVYKMDLGDGPYTVPTQVSGSGRIELTPAGPTFSALQKVGARAIADAGWEFSAWRGMLRSQRNPDTFLVDHSQPLEAVFVSAGERINDGDFTDGIGGWTSWHDDAVPTTITTTGGEACMRLTASSTDAWKSQFDRPGMRFVQGETYQLSFKARANAPRSISANLVMDHEPHTPLATARRVALPAGASRQTATLVASKTDSVARLEFDFGDDTVGFCLDSVSLRRTDGSAVRARSILASGSAAGPLRDPAGRLAEPRTLSVGVERGKSRLVKKPAR